MEIPTDRWLERELIVLDRFSSNRWRQEASVRTTTRFSKSNTKSGIFRSFRSRTSMQRWV